LAFFVLAISSSSSLICFFVLFFGGFLNLYGSVAIGWVCQFWDFFVCRGKGRRSRSWSRRRSGGVVVVKDRVESLGDGSTEL